MYDNMRKKKHPACTIQAASTSLMPSMEGKIAEEYMQNRINTDEKKLKERGKENNKLCTAGDKNKS